MLQKSPMYSYIPARDMARARAFYEGRLGFVAKEETAGVVYEFGAHTACFLYPTPNAGTSQASQAFWAVADVDREIDELKARGVVFEDYDMPGEKRERRRHRRWREGRVVQGQRGQHHGAGAKPVASASKGSTCRPHKTSFPPPNWRDAACAATRPSRPSTAPSAPHCWPQKSSCGARSKAPRCSAARCRPAASSPRTVWYPKLEYPGAPRR